MDRLLLTCNHRNFTACLNLARKHQAGLEIQTFAHPHVLDGNWRDVLTFYLSELQGFQGEIACHGAFYDLSSGSPDRMVRDVVQPRRAVDLAVVVSVIDVPVKITALAEVWSAMVSAGLIIVEDVNVLLYRGGAASEAE